MGNYSVWWTDTENESRCVLSGIPDYAMASRLVCRLQELFGGYAHIEKD